MKINESLSVNQRLIFQAKKMKKQSYWKQKQITKNYLKTITKTLLSHWFFNVYLSFGIHTGYLDSKIHHRYQNMKMLKSHSQPSISSVLHPGIQPTTGWNPQYWMEEHSEVKWREGKGREGKRKVARERKK